MCKKTCMAVQLTDYMTAADIIGRFRNKRKNSVKEYSNSKSLTVSSPSTKCRSDSDLDKDEDDAFSLFECGGNIGEHGPAVLLIIHSCRCAFQIWPHTQTVESNAVIFYQISLKYEHCYAIILPSFHSFQWRLINNSFFLFFHRSNFATFQKHQVIFKQFFSCGHCQLFWIAISSIILNRHFFNYFESPFLKSSVIISGERCLHGETNISALLKANPHGELIIKYNPLWRRSISMYICTSYH